MGKGNVDSRLAEGGVNQQIQLVLTCDAMLLYASLLRHSGVLLTYKHPRTSNLYSWGFDTVGRGEVVVTARWHYDKHFTRKSNILASTFMGGKAKVRKLLRCVFFRKKYVAYG